MRRRKYSWASRMTGIKNKCCQESPTPPASYPLFLASFYHIAPSLELATWLFGKPKFAIPRNSRVSSYKFLRQCSDWLNLDLVPILGPVNEPGCWIIISGQFGSENQVMDLSENRSFFSNNCSGLTKSKRQLQFF